jgi:hypothetical protein
MSTTGIGGDELSMSRIDDSGSMRKDRSIWARLERFVAFEFLAN